MDPFETLLRETVADVRYKHWYFHVEKDGIGLWYLQVRFLGEHASSGEVTNWSGRKWRMSMHMTRSEIAQTALLAVLAAEEHEARERFLYRGRAVFGPHFNIEALWDLAGDPSGHEKRIPA